MYTAVKAMTSNIFHIKALSTFQFSLNVVTEYAETSDKIFVKKLFKPATFSEPEFTEFHFYLRKTPISSNSRQSTHN